MKRFFVRLRAVSFGAMAFACGGAANAADMPVKAPVFKAAPVFDWSGFYLGGYAGVGAQQSRGESISAGGIDFVGSAFTGGITAGYSFQLAPNWVAGIEGDFGSIGLDHKFLDWNDPNVFFNDKTSWIATLRGRLGYSNGPNLNYVTAGAAWVHDKDAFTSGAVTNKQEDTKAGFAIGSGVETMLGGNWSAKAEYLFADTGKGDRDPSLGVKIDHQYQTMRYGLNYRFGGRPAPALPAHNWAGFYAGITGGSTLADVRAHDPSAVPVDGVVNDNGAGFAGGAIAGFNWQLMPSLVAGIEADFSYFGINRARPDVFDFSGLRNAKLTVDTGWLATLRGRLGYSTGPAFLYITGGAAWIDLKDTWQGTHDFALGSSVSSSKTLSGWTVGGGIETVLGGQWTSRTEYLFVDAGKGDALTSTATGGLLPTTMQADHEFHVFRTGLTYSFATR